MKAVHISWVVVLGSVSVLLAQGALALKGQPVDWTAIGTAVMALIGAFTPAAQLGLSAFVPPKVQGSMPVLKP